MNSIYNSKNSQFFTSIIFNSAKLRLSNNVSANSYINFSVLSNPNYNCLPIANDSEASLRSPYTDFGPLDLHTRHWRQTQLLNPNQISFSTSPSQTKDLLLYRAQLQSRGKYSCSFTELHLLIFRNSTAIR